MKQIEPILSCDVIKTDVSCVKIFNDIILIGNGYYLHVYCRKENILQKKLYIFDEHIFGIDINRNNMLVYGGIYLKIYRFDPLFLEFEELALHISSDWITTAKFLDDGNYIAIVDMHNVATLFDSSLCVVENKECVERCILYCSHVVGNNWNELIILSGTVFSQILLWRPAKTDGQLCPVIFRLCGHKGVIFSIDCNQSLNMVCTTSDDRTAKLWFIPGEDLREELSQNSVDIVCKHTLIGHTARVFKCKLLNDTVITGGEDGVVNVWNTNGEIIRTVDVHQGGPVWSLDICEKENIVVTGGGDSGVFLFKLHLHYFKSELMRNLNETPRRVLILSSDTLAYLTDRGALIRYNITKNTFTDIFTHDDLKSYGLLEKSPCGKLIALAGYKGELHLYKNSSKSLEYKYSCQIKSKERIFALHWLSCSSLLTCGVNGVLTLWLISKTTMFPIQFWQLPYSKERWSNAACLCENGSVLIGDRRGALYLYIMNSSEPVQVIRRAHNYLGVTHISYNKGKVISLGRNSIVNEYKMDTTRNHLIQISSHKVPFSWLAGLFQQNCSSYPFLIGFSSTNFVIYDYNTRRTLLETDCGGGHRSWNFHVADHLVTFSYIKDNKIILFKCDLANITGTDIIKGFHLNEINALKCILTGTRDEVLFVSGGEDTVIRLCLRNLHDTQSDFRHLNVLKSHLSSIRTIAITKIEDSKYYIFTGGGRAQIILWELSTNTISDMNAINCREKYNYYTKSNDISESETRVMSMCTLIIEKIVFLLAAFSDGTVKIFKVGVKNDGGLGLILTKQIPIYKAKCIFQMSILSTGCYYVLTTMASDGYIVFTDITQIFSNESSSKCHTITSIKAHQSGINAFSYYNKTRRELFFLTGGDDTAIALNAFNLNERNGVEIEHISKFSDQFYHGAQVTGTYINEKYFLTASIDQKVILFKWDFQEKFNVMCLQEYSSSICDIKGLECIPIDDCVKIIVYGRGCEIINCNRTLL